MKYIFSKHVPCDFALTSHNVQIADTNPWFEKYRAQIPNFIKICHAVSVMKLSGGHVNIASSICVKCRPIYFVQTTRKELNSSRVIVEALGFHTNRTVG
jgi:hypothetical protein